MVDTISWAMRAAVFAGGAIAPLCADAMTGWSGVARVVTNVAIWAAWAVALLCVLVPSSVSLTAIRLVCPTSIVSSGIVVVLDGDSASGVALVLAIVATLLVFSADVGESFVQVSAYGDERRHLLRCPATMASIQILAWIAWVSSIVTTTSFGIGQNRIGATLSGVVAIVLSWLLPRRFHRYSRRWLVQVPAGLVVHDHVVLAETAMFLARDIRSVEAATIGSSDAADLTGGCRGPALRVTLDDFETVVLSATRADPGGRAVHVRSMMVCPSRLGRALAELTTPPPSTTSPASS